MDILDKKLKKGSKGLPALFINYLKMNQTTHSNISPIPLF